MTLTVRSATVSGATTKGSALSHAEVDANWDHVANFTQSGTGATSRTVQAKLRDWVSVKDFGAVGDGATDDYTAFVNAIASLGTNGGAVYVPAGEYLLGTALTPSKKVRLYGDGTSETSSAGGATRIIKKSTLTTAVLTFTVNNSSVEGIEFEGENGNTGDGIQVSANRVHLKEVAVYSMGQDGIRIGTTAGVNANLWHFENIKAKSNGRHGVFISDKTSPTAPDCNAGTFVHADLQGNTSDGLRLGNCDLNTFVGVTVQTNGGDGVHLEAGATDNAFFGGDFHENNTDFDLEIESGATRNAFFWSAVTSANTSDSGTSTMLFTRDGKLPAISATADEVNGLDISLKVRLFDDFLGDVIADQWNGRVGTDPQCVAPAILANQNRGLLRLVAGDDAAATMAANGVQLESALNWRAVQGGLVLEARFAINTITSVAVFVGFTDQASALEIPVESAASGDTITTNASNAVGVMFDTAMSTDNWWLVGVANDVDATSQDAGVAPVAVTQETWRIELSTAGVATFYRNGTQVGTTMTGAVTASTQLTPVIAMFSRTTATRSLDCDYLYVQSTR